MLESTMHPTRSYLSVNLLVEASIKERAGTTPVKPDKPLKLAQLRAAKRIWLNAGVLRELSLFDGSFAAFCGGLLRTLWVAQPLLNFGAKLFYPTLVKISGTIS